MTDRSPENLRQVARKHMWPIFGRGDAYLEDSSVSPIIVGAEGSYVIDADGRRYLDATGAQATSSLGYSAAAVADHLAKHLHSIQANPSTFLPHAPAIRLAEKIAGLAPAGFNKVFFVVNGTDANETAIRMARQFFRIKGEAARRQIVARWKGYHGSSLVTAAASGNTARRRMATPLPDGFLHIEPPDPRQCPFGSDQHDCAPHGAAQLRRIAERHHPSNLAAFLGEPTIGGGGVFPGPPGYWRGIRDVCDESGMLLIFDEVITAFGRVGEWFESHLLHEKEGVLPDIITFGKGVTAGYYPLGGVLVSDRVAETFESSGSYLDHGYTFGATPLGCEAALATIDSLKQQGVLPAVRDKSVLLRDLLEELRRSSSVVSEVRSRGLMCGVDIIADKETRRPFRDEEDARWFLIREGLQRGLLMVVSGTTINVIPSLTISTKEIRELVDMLALVLAAVEDQVSSGQL